MNVGGIEKVQVARANGVLAFALVEYDHYFHMSDKHWPKKPTYNEETRRVVGYEFSGPTGTHSVHGEDHKRASAHWAGFCQNNGIKATALTKARTGFRSYYA